MTFLGYFLYALLGALLSKAGVSIGMWQAWAIMVTVTAIDVLSHVKAIKGKDV